MDDDSVKGQQSMCKDTHWPIAVFITNEQNVSQVICSSNTTPQSDHSPLPTHLQLLEGTEYARDSVHSASIFVYSHACTRNKKRLWERESSSRRVGEAQVVPTRSRPLRHGVCLARKPLPVALEIAPVRGSRQAPLWVVSRLEALHLGQRQRKLGYILLF